MKAPWQLLRLKADHDTADADWLATNDLTALRAAGGVGRFAPESGHDGRPYTGIETWISAVNASGAIQNRTEATHVTTQQLIEVIDLERDGLGGNPAVREGMGDSTPVGTTNVPLQRIAYHEINGAGEFTIRITGNTTMPAGATDLEIWYRPVTR